MASGVNRIIAPELEEFIVNDVQFTGRLLGEGAYGSVEEAEILGATVAAKKLHAIFSPQQGMDTKLGRDFMQECRLISEIRHPHIVEFRGIFYPNGSRLPVLLMEKLQTSLDNLLETTPNIPLNLKVHFLAGTSRGLVYLHGHTPPIAHRDLSAKNILVDNDLNAKIADLGVSRLVNIQPGELAAKMTHRPGNVLYMPPEANQDGVTRYNTSIDIFSLGVVSLFTLTQTFPKDLKPATYRDPATGKIVGQSEIERRESYITEMKSCLGETHPLVKLTLDCLEYTPEDRPSAEDVLRRLEEVGTTLPQNCTQTKLQLIQGVQEATDRIAAEKQAKINEVQELQTTNKQLQARVDHLLTDIDCLQAESQAQVCELKKQLEAQKTEIACLSVMRQLKVTGLPKIAFLPKVEYRNVLLVGITGSGKSAVANAIAGSDRFIVSHARSSSIMCDHCEVIYSEVSAGTYYYTKVIDTAGLFDTRGITNDHILTEIKAYLNKHFPEGLNLIIFVQRSGRFIPEEVLTLKSIKAKFNDISGITALVMTSCELMSEKYRTRCVEEFLTGPVTASIAKFMKAGIYAVGFPQECDYPKLPSLKKYYEERIANDREKLWNVIKKCSKAISGRQLFRRF